MARLSVAFEVARSLLCAQAEQLLSAVGVCDELALLDPSRCRGWSRLDLIVHVRSGLDEMAATAHVHSPNRVDHDAASYWTSHPDDRDSDPVAHILWLRRSASAYGRPRAAVRHLTDAVQRAEASVRAMTDAPVLFQGKTLTAGDFVATWVVELAIHLLDLDVAATPVGGGLTRSTIEALAEHPLPEGLGADEAILVALGRQPWPADLPTRQGYPLSL